MMCVTTNCRQCPSYSKSQDNCMMSHVDRFGSTLISIKLLSNFDSYYNKFKFHYDLRLKQIY